MFLSTYPPRECGIATFTQDLLESVNKFLRPNTLCKVAALNITPLDTYNYAPEVIWELDQNDSKDYCNLANVVNNDRSITGVIIQHEYGIFGGVQGSKVIHFMERCKKPIVITLHTVLPSPDTEMKETTKKIILFSDTIIVLTQKSKEILEELYPESRGKVSVIPHGIHQTTFSPQKKYKTKLELENQIILSTFGLLSPGKGIEYVIKALPELVKKYPSLLYLILGETHPVVRRRDGERYRNMLSRLVKKLNLEKHVKFYDQYLSLTDLFEFLKATDIYISTSTNPNQAVSGTLSYALGTGRAVISTNFAQAEEIITYDIGRLIPIQDSPALTMALMDLLSNEKQLYKMSKLAYERTRPMLWSNVAKQYIELLMNNTTPPLKLDHLYKMTDSFGLFQFAKFSKPNKAFGYTLDDNARALTFCSMHFRKNNDTTVEKFITIYLHFIEYCQSKDGSFTNYIDTRTKEPTLQNKKEDIEETQARALQALSEVLTNTNLSPLIQSKAKKIFIRALENNLPSVHLRTKALSIKAFTQAVSHLPEHKDFLKLKIDKYALSLSTALKTNPHKNWDWFENTLRYNNGILPEGLFLAGHTQEAEKALNFLIKQTFSVEMYCPIGQSEWYIHKGKRSIYDQQPEDPASMISVLDCAYKHTKKEEYKNLAKLCFTWFLGNNTAHKYLYEKKTGGCYDGLHPNRVNQNQGAESLVSYLMSSLIISNLL